VLFGQGISTSYTTVNIKVTYSLPGKTDFKTFDVRIYPKSAVVALCRSQTNSLFTKTGAVSAITYTVGVTGTHTLTPASYTAVAPTDATNSNTALPTCSFYTMLEYSMDNGSTYNTFPDYPQGATFTSTNNDASCVTKVESKSNWGLVLNCSDNTKFATNGDIVIYLRYSAQWTQVEDAPNSLFDY